MSAELTRRDALKLALTAGAGAALAGGALTRGAFAATPASYDDGTSAVPGALAGDPERVIVVGAGWAGLTIANALRGAGVDHVVLDARKRIGGRAHTVDLGGVPIDLGCSWIHQPYGNPMTRFAEQAGVTRVNGNIELDAPIIRYFDAHVDRELSPLEKGPAFMHALNFAENESAAIGEQLGRRASVRDGAQAYLDRWLLQGDARRQAEFLIRLVSELATGYDWAAISLHHWAWGNSESTYLGVGEGDLPRGGYRRLVRAMAGSDEVWLGHRVVAVERKAGGVVVHARTGRRRRRVRGSHVVITVPLGVLRSGSIRFAPRLPAHKRAAMGRIGFGAVEKVAMVFDDPFWADLAHTHMLFLSDHAPFELPMFLDLNRTSGQPALVAFSGGGFARELHRMRSAEALDLTLTRLREILGRDVPRPRAHAVTDWQGDPFSRGAYSATRVGGTNDDYDMLAEPVGGRVLFAGEATNRARHSLADGAMSTGIREAKRLLRSPAVTLAAV